MSQDPIWTVAKYGMVSVFTALGFTFLLFALGVLDPQPTQPWGVYVEQATLGETEPGTRTVSRRLNDEGFPITDSLDGAQFTTVKCGPLEPIELSSHREWFVLGLDGDPIELPTTSEFVFELPAPEEPCEPITFGSVDIPAEVAAIAAGQPIKFELTLTPTDLGLGFGPVSLSSEYFVYDPAAGGGTPDTTNLAVPANSPIN